MCHSSTWWLDDDDHTYDYVIEMLQKLFCMSEGDAYNHAVEVDSAGRTVVITCELPAAELAATRSTPTGPTGACRAHVDPCPPW